MIVDVMSEPSRSPDTDSIIARLGNTKQEVTINASDRKRIICLTQTMRVRFWKEIKVSL